MLFYYILGIVAAPAALINPFSAYTPRLACDSVTKVHLSGVHCCLAGPNRRFVIAESRFGLIIAAYPTTLNLVLRAKGIRL